MKSNHLFSITLLLLLLVSSASYSKQKQHYYQLKIYHLKTKSQEDRVDRFLKDAYLPALHRMGIKQVGVFKPVTEESEGKLIYVFISTPQLDQLVNIDGLLERDKVYLTAGKEYLDASHDDPPFTRIESTLMKAFQTAKAPAMPKLTSPRSERIYELRSYEGPTEKLSANKIHMFDNGEIDIFNNLDFNPVFYGQVISGSTMPNFMYMTTFNNKADRDEHWKAFSPVYKPMSQLPQYQNNMSKNVTLFLYPTEYSDF